MNKLRREIQKAQDTSYQMTIPNMVGRTALTTGLLYGGYRLAGKIETPVPLGNLRFLEQQSLPFLDASGQLIQGRPWYEALGKTRQTKATVQDLILNAVKASEEQLLRIPRAFSFYSMLSGQRLKNAFDAGYVLNSQMLAPHKRYLEIISGGLINDTEISRGLLFQDGKIYGKGGRELLSNAAIHFNYWNSAHDAGLTREQISGGVRKGFASRWTQALYRKYGLNPSNSPFIITGGTNRFESLWRKFNANIMVGVENYMKLLDDPFEAILKPAENILGPRVGGALRKGSRFWNTIGVRNILGVGGWDNLRRGGGIGRLVGRQALRGLPIIAAGLYGFSALDEMLHGKIKGTAAGVYQDVNLLATRVSDITGLTALTKKQKEVAPGSTSIMGLASLPLSLAIAGATTGGIQNLIEKVPVGEKAAPPQWFLKAAQTGEELPGFIGRAIKNMRLGTKSRVGAYAIAGAAVGALLRVPFLPGALGSEKSAEEKSKIYSGEQLLPVRYGRKWEFGLSPYEGEDIKLFEPHWTVKFITDAAKKSKLGKYYGQPVLRAINRLVDPYYLERDLDEERPYVYWGPTDHGLGFIEKLATPIKEIFKPTILAHPEALGVDHPSRNKRISKIPPESLTGPMGISTGNVFPELEKPGSVKSYVSETVGSFKDMLGLIGFTYGAGLSKVSGGQGLLNTDAVHESSGRILSAQRAYWDAELGGFAGLNEFYRRLNPNREYGTEYMQGAIKNTQPSWLPEELQYGDPYASIQQGEYRLPGRGYEALHPELKGVPYDEYPSIHRLNILQDVSRNSIEYYRALNQVEQSISEDRATRDTVDMYSTIMERDAMLVKEQEEGRFNYGDKGPLSAFWLAQNKLGRAIPTEHLYPISPVHKFGGPVDPMSEYKSMVLLDSPFKSWDNPISDYITPTFNRVMDIATFGNFVPSRTKENWAMEDYFQSVQFAKNLILDEESQKYFNQGNIEAAAYIKSGKRNTIYDTSPLADIGDHGALVNEKQRRYFNAFAGINPDQRSSVLQKVSGDMGTMLQGQWFKQDMMARGDIDRLTELQRTTGNIGEGITADQIISQGDVPDRDFVGYAPGVNLNAFKVKVADQLGKNIRDFNLWKEDERQARLVDALSRNSFPDSPINDSLSQNRDSQKSRLKNTLKSMGMRNVEMNTIPVTGLSRVHFQGKMDNRDRLHKIMLDEGYVVY